MLDRQAARRPDPENRRLDGLQFIIDPPLSGLENMARDRDLLDKVRISPDPLTLARFYRWQRPTAVSYTHLTLPTN